MTGLLKPKLVLPVLIAAALAAVFAAAQLLGFSRAQASPAHAAGCSLATLHGTYLFSGDGWSVSGSTAVPLAFAGSETLDGSGHVQGISSSSFNGSITRSSAFTGTYTLAANCTGTLTIGTTLHFDTYVAPSGAHFAYLQTDSGSVSATTENQATRA